MSQKRSILSIILAVSVLCSHVNAADRGPVTNLPMPRYVSMKADEGNVRRGPSLDHRIDWVFRHQGQPLRVIGEYGHWRRVEDQDGQGGWIHFRLISGVRTVLFTGNKTAIRRKSYEGAKAVAMAEQGAIAQLGECKVEWCKIRRKKVKGWIRKSEVWGVDAAELRE